MKAAENFYLDKYCHDNLVSPVSLSLSDLKLNSSLIDVFFRFFGDALCIRHLLCLTSHLDLSALCFSHC